MKKNIVRIILFMFVFMLFTSNVKAADICYGTYFDDDLGYWDRQKQQETSTFPENYSWFGNVFCFTVADNIDEPIIGGYNGNVDGLEFFDNFYEPNIFRSENDDKYWSEFITTYDITNGVSTRKTVDVKEDTREKFRDKRVHVTNDKSAIVDYYKKHGELPPVIYFCMSTRYSLLVDNLIAGHNLFENEIKMELTYYVNDFDVIYDKDTSFWSRLADSSTCFYATLDPNVDLNACYGLENILENLSAVGTNKGCMSKDFIDFYQEVQGKCDTYIINHDTDGCTDLCNKLAKKRDEMCGTETVEVKCKSLGPQMVGWLVRILKIIRYIVPVLAIILSIMDFISAIASADDDALKKAGQRFVKRIIAVVIFFLLPVILQLLFDVFKINGLESGNPYCMK